MTSATLSKKKKNLVEIVLAIEPPEQSRILKETFRKFQKVFRFFPNLCKIVIFLKSVFSLPFNIHIQTPCFGESLFYLFPFISVLEIHTIFNHFKRLDFLINIEIQKICLLLFSLDSNWKHYISKICFDIHQTQYLHVELSRSFF